MRAALQLAFAALFAGAWLQAAPAAASDAHVLLTTGTGASAAAAAVSAGGSDDSAFFQSVAGVVEQRRMGGKTEWPELVGVPCEEAKQTLEAATDKSVQLVPAHSMVTMDYRTDRIRVFCAADGTVSKTPRVG